MKHVTRNFVMLAALSFLMYGCTAGQYIKPNQAQIDTYISSHPDLSEFDKQLIVDGRFEMGMKAETVKFLLGDPYKVEVVKQPWATQERWIYKRGGTKIFIIEERHVVGIEEL